jgi:hypothetical protein
MQVLGENILKKIMCWSFPANFYEALKYLMPLSLAEVLFLIGWRTSNWLSSCYLLVNFAVLKGAISNSLDARENCYAVLWKNYPANNNTLIGVHLN